jgi:DNA-binding beta-propeller fold protein YncE
VALRIVDGHVTLLGSVDVGAFPEGVAFSEDGRFVYVGNFASNTISVLRVGPNGLVDTHDDVQLSGPPASLRVGSQ